MYKPAGHGERRNEDARERGGGHLLTRNFFFSFGPPISFPAPRAPEIRFAFLFNRLPSRLKIASSC